VLCACGLGAERIGELRDGASTGWVGGATRIKWGLPHGIYHVGSTMWDLPCEIYHMGSTMRDLPCGIYSLSSPHLAPNLGSA